MIDSWFGCSAISRQLRLRHGAPIQRSPRELADEFLGPWPGAVSSCGIEVPDAAHGDHATAPRLGERFHSIDGPKGIVRARSDDARERKDRARYGQPAVLSQSFL